ncbi:MAG: chemotaxis protein CheA [Desulfobacterales bacterium]|nr:chemotaxis protein CheA [Desulfobacterales bacterium]
MNESNDHSNAYRQEAEELLQDIEETVLDLEKNPDDAETINRLFRAIHTIKGSGAMFGFDEIAAFTHHVETVLDKVRDGTIPISQELIDLILRARDEISTMLQSVEGKKITLKSSENNLNSQKIISDLKALLPTQANPVSIPSIEENKYIQLDHKEKSDHTYRIRFNPEAGIFASGMDPILILDELRSLGECAIISQTEEIPVLLNLIPENCYLFWDIILTTEKDINAIKDVFIFIQEDSDISIQEIADFKTNLNVAHKRIGEILVDRGDVTLLELNEVLAGQKPIGNLLIESGSVSKEKIKSALTEQQFLKRQKKTPKVAGVRVPAERLDRLINLVGELVITQARLTQITSEVNAAELNNTAEEIERLTSELRDCVLNIRMLPIGTTFSTFKRLVRDLSIELQKEIDLVTEGGDTELDKTIIESLNDPLVHLIRNSIDHGIEAPENRKAIGKSRRGKICLSAAHVGASVVITVSDDGAGIKLETIKAKAIEKGLIQSDSDLDENEILNLIFEPGFSTAQNVTSISGRGVGMDVVKREIDAMRGTIEISSKQGCGTTITINLPLTLAIIDGLLVKVNTNRFVLPLSMVEECVELSQNDLTKAHNRYMIDVRGEWIPYVRLREIFNILGDRPGREHIAIVRLENQRFGIVVDEIMGDHQTVIKSLGRIYADAEGISGATILGDGGIALILDAIKVIRCAEQEEARALTSKIN